ncbi:ribbon-helix-helix protein, CopG family [Candidatus Acetothermia bacterium]|nr:ribbon-helix-helix protein, CopG family [Candidatus Acetothermia bacterium]MBI3659716.1 ribbon-helix-helix protein, CopG family [Candidatus Acetothermia bacterium]
MKSRVTLTLNPKSIEFLDTLARRQKTSRSAALEALLQEHFSRREEEELAQLAQEFFATPELTEEIAERRAWEKLGLEVLSREDD